LSHQGEGVPGRRGCGNEGRAGPVGALLPPLAAAAARQEQRRRKRRETGTGRSTFVTSSMIDSKPPQDIRTPSNGSVLLHQSFRRGSAITFSLIRSRASRDFAQGPRGDDGLVVLQHGLRRRRHLAPPDRRRRRTFQY
jgi:hypothetical protein